MAMRPLGEMLPGAAAQVSALFCDIDDTLTTDGLLRPEASEAIWRLRDAGVAVVLVTGRPAGWGDPLARLLPVAGAITENGAVAFWCVGRTMHRWYARPPRDMRDDQARLLDTALRIVREIPQCRLAADQPFRISDVAIDFAEEIGPLPLETARRIRKRFEETGAKAKISSIHVNAWFGEFDKATSCERFAAERFGIDIASPAAAYVGDSPNDEPLFERFGLSFGVANVARFAGMMEHRPAYLASRSASAGFAEIAEALLRGRKPA